MQRIERGRGIESFLRELECPALSNQWATMKPLLKRYLVLGIVVQFVVAGIVDFGGLLLAGGLQGGGMRIPSLTLFFISIRHRGFALPLALLILTVVLFHRERAEGVLLHLFGGMMMAAIVIVMIIALAFLLPMVAMT